MSTELKSCFVCSGRVSINAKHCPHCGQPRPASYGKHPFWSSWLGEVVMEIIILRLGVGFIFIAILLFIFWIFYG